MIVLTFYVFHQNLSKSSDEVVDWCNLIGSVCFEYLLSVLPVFHLSF